MLTKETFWRLVQDPVTREKDPTELIALAEEALRKLPHPEIHVSAANVIIYRTLEMRMNYPAMVQVLKAQQSALLALASQESFGAVRWYLSGNLSSALIRASTNNIGPAKDALIAALGKYDIAQKLGQPFTNVVKAAAFLCSLLALEGDDDTARTVIRRFVIDANKAPLFYSFSNKYAFEEVSYVFKLLTPMSAVYFGESLASQDWRVIGGEFGRIYRLLREKATT